MTDPTIMNALRGSQLASELSDHQMRTVADHLVFRDLQPGEVLSGKEPPTITCMSLSAAPSASSRMLGQPSSSPPDFSGFL